MCFFASLFLLVKFCFSLEFLSSCLPVSFLKRERRKPWSWKWGEMGRIWKEMGRGNHDLNILFKK